jgi:hypothetical protein
MQMKPCVLFVSLLVQNFNRIDDELPPVSFVLRKQFREALSIWQKKQKRSGGGWWWWWWWKERGERWQESIEQKEKQSTESK